MYTGAAVDSSLLVVQSISKVCQQSTIFKLIFNELSKRKFSSKRSKKYEPLSKLYDTRKSIIGDRATFARVYPHLSNGRGNEINAANRNIDARDIRFTRNRTEDNQERFRFTGNGVAGDGVSPGRFKRNREGGVGRRLELRE